MDRKPQIMPYMVTVESYHPFTARYYNKKGESLYPMGREYPGFGYIELTYELLLRLLSIRTMDEAASFLAEYPNLRFASYDNAIAADRSSLAEYDTLNQYNKLVVNSVRLLNYIFALPKLLNQQSTSPSIEQRKRIERMYRYVFPFVVDPKYSWESYYQMIKHFTDSISSADEVDEEYSNCEIPSDDDSVDSEKYKLDDQMPITAFFTEEEINQNKYKTVVGPFTLRLDKAVDSMMSSMIDKFMRDNLGRAKIFYNTAERVLDCRCPDLLCASCMMYYVVRHNEVEYRECATPGCHQMFIVDNPLRKHCDKHIEPLRRKRENQRAVKKSQKETNANKEINQLQSYLGELIEGSDMLSVADNTDRFVVCTNNRSSFTITIQKN